MTGKNTRSKRMIEKLGLLFDVYYDDKTYKNIKKILDCYREYVFEQDIFKFNNMDTRSVDEILPDIYKSFISKKAIDDKTVNMIVMQMINDELTGKILRKTLQEIRSFREEGEDYNYILEQLYFTENGASNTDIYLDLNLSPTQYSYRKEEAIMLFGIYFWQECLKYWENWERDIDKIKRSMGRGDLVHKIQTA